MRVATWQRAVGPHFDFLLGHGFALDESLGTSNAWATSVTYSSETRAVIVVYSVEFTRVEVTLARLVNRDVPAPLVFFTEGAAFDRTLLDNILIARTPERVEGTQGAAGLGRAAIQRQLALWAGVQVVSRRYRQK